MAGAFVSFTLRGLFSRFSPRRRIRIVVFAFPVLCFLAALLFAAEAALYILRAEQVTGKVVELHEWPGETIFDRGSINYEPVFTYKIDGEQRRASVGSGHSSFNIPVGEIATIRAIPSSRGNVRLDTWQGLWFMPVMLGLIGLVAFIPAVLIWLILGRTVLRKDES